VLTLGETKLLAKGRIAKGEGGNQLGLSLEPQTVRLRMR